jgi:hypothetical protein
VLLVGGAFCVTDAPVFKLPLVVVAVGMMATVFLEAREEAKFTKQQPTAALVQDSRESLYGEEFTDSK